ncbi:MAG: peptidoglycan DD-metalloendopeptidase family protein [Candidatus Eremiobacteraeota bacterium]|nr:peptidoglycan DD-metalloendopeptidase family protein [Candidatus Eremiobacteraeota bacterium]MBC5828514.1 peptidoglycan DD-metalloendopeptidase family protein [Candidatus Eremiobacteraeota bacterium]
MTVKGCAALAMALLILMRPSPAATSNPIVEKIKEKQAQIEATRQKLDASRQKLHAARFRVQTVSQELNDTQVAIGRVSGSIDALTGSIATTRERLDLKRRRLADTEKRLDRHRTALDRRLVDVYEYGPASYLEVLFASTSFIDFLERWDFLRYIIIGDSSLIQAINGEAVKYQRLVADLETEEHSLDAQEQDQERQRMELSSLAGQRSALLAVARAQRNVVAQQVYELEGLTAAQEARLQDLIREKQREDAEAVARARLAAEQARRAAAIAAGVPLPPEGPNGPVLFMWPAHGAITSPFGMRTDPVTGRYQLHSGIDIGAGYGTPIMAAADGVVIYAGWYGGYGNAIILDNGSSLSTLYAHCSAMYVSPNQHIQRGQVIGAVGATGWATGPHLHFEIRVNGVPVNPLSRL